MLLLLVSLQQVDGCVHSIPSNGAATGSAFRLNLDVRFCSDRGAPPDTDRRASSPLARVPPSLSMDLLADLLQVPQGDGIAGLHFGYLLLQLQHFGLVLLESHKATFIINFNIDFMPVGK